MRAPVRRTGGTIPYPAEDAGPDECQDMGRFSIFLLTFQRWQVNLFCHTDMHPFVKFIATEATSILQPKGDY